MAAFRRCIPALLVVLLFMGATTTMNAQTPGPAFACTANAGVPPILRSEGLTELMGDIVINCTGGTPTAVTSAFIPTANITVFVNTQVTSRILNSGTSAGNISEGLLMIDEPGGNGSPIAAMNLCPSVTGCNIVPTGGVVNPFIANANTFQGLVSGNSMTFLGIPVEPPGSTGTRVFRITNVRVNASALAPSGAIPGQVTASVSSSGSTSLPINNPTVVTGFTQQGLTYAVRNADNSGSAGAADKTFLQCTDAKKAHLFLRFNEGFTTAWKLQVAASGQSVPGAIYNTESGFIPGANLDTSLPNTTTANVGPSTGVAGAGLADFATRIKATFNNIPAGVSIYVPVTITSGRGTTASLTLSETAPFVAVASTDKFSGTDVAPVALSNGAGTAVWQITASNPVIADQLDAAVYFNYTANPGAGTPALGTGTVNVSFAPTYDLTVTPGAANAQTSLFPIPRFVVAASESNLISIVICRTNLLFPFVTNQAGFDTGIAIANTTQDTFGTVSQSGTCTLNFFGANAPSAKTSAAFGGGTTTTFLASTDFANFQGYIIAVCNFQFAHGFAFISDLGARNLAMGYLAGVIPDVKPRFAGALTDTVTGESLGQ